jgi:hypothetical protein
LLIWNKHRNFPEYLLRNTGRHRRRRRRPKFLLLLFLHQDYASNN